MTSLKGGRSLKERLILHGLFSSNTCDLSSVTVRICPLEPTTFSSGGALSASPGVHGERKRHGDVFHAPHVLDSQEGRQGGSVTREGGVFRKRRKNRNALPNAGVPFSEHPKIRFETALIWNP